MRRLVEAHSFLWLSARISRYLKYFIYAFAAVYYHYIIHFLMKWVELRTFHIRYRTLSSFSASGNAAQIISDPRRGCYIVLPMFIFFFFFFFPPLLSGPYPWNRYSQRLQIKCAAWSCCLILHYSLPSNSLRYLFFFLFFRHDFVAAISLEPSLVETPD